MKNIHPTRRSFKPMIPARGLLCALGAACLAGPGPALAGYDETDKLTASDAEAIDQFGYSVGISGNTAIVGAQFDDTTPEINSGSAYLFDTATGSQIVKLTASDAESNDNFGTSVGISGNTAIVGAHLNDDSGPDSGSAYLFNATTGSQLFKLTADDAAAGDLFGVSVGISGNTAIVGAYHDDSTAGSDSGSAYLFDATTGGQLYKLTADDAAADDEFGFSVGISGNTAIVGAHLNDDSGTDAGSAYLFDASTGSQIAKLTASDAAAGDNFGVSVGISGNTAIVGAWLDGDSGSASGSAYLFDATTGDQLYKLTASDAAAGDFFGVSVDISGNTAIVGSYASDDAGSASGSAYLFDASTGSQIAKLTASDDAGGDLFGWSVGISDNTAIVGAYLDDTSAGSDFGSAYLFGADQLTESPIAGGDLTFTLDTDQAATLDDIIALTNTGVAGTTIEVTGFSITGTDATLFELPDFASATLVAGDADTAAYDLRFLGTATEGDYTALLTLRTDSGDVVYNLSAEVVPEPDSLALLGLGGLLIARRRRD